MLWFCRFVAIFHFSSADVGPNKWAWYTQEVLHPYRPPKDAAAAASYFALVKAGRGNGFIDEADIGGGEHRSYLNVLADSLGMKHVSFNMIIETWT
jgi:hypothetical protein